MSEEKLITTEQMLAAFDRAILDLFNERRVHVAGGDFAYAVNALAEARSRFVDSIIDERYMNEREHF